MSTNKSELKEWRFHVFWSSDETDPTVDEASRLREALLEEIKRDKAFVAVCDGVTNALVPGLKARPPPANYRSITRDPRSSLVVWVPHESLGHAVAWFTLHRGSLSILLHPVTRFERRDHTIHAMWLGPPVELDMDKLRMDLKSTPRQFPELGLGYSKKIQWV